MRGGPEVLAMIALAMPAAAQRQFEEPGKRGLPASDGPTTAMVLGDLDGDGDLDLVCGNRGQQSCMYVNDGSGTFLNATAGQMPVGAYATSTLALGDVDGDGDLDLVVGNRAQPNRLYRNQGNAAFTDVTATNMPANSAETLALALGDLDGDGDLDLVVGNQLHQSRLLRNNGAGLFTDVTATHMPAGVHETTSLALGDLDGDGDMDIVLGDGSGQNRLLRNDGTGAFSDVTSSHMPLAPLGTSAVALGDVDMDGDLDLTVGNPLQACLFVNDGTGVFADGTAARMPAGSHMITSLALGDLDGDADPDLVVGTRGQSLLYRNNGLGVFADATAHDMPVGACTTLAVQIGDVDGDTSLDMILGNDDQQNRLYLNDGTGTFADATSTPMPVRYHQTMALALGDIDRDGDLDLIFGNRPDCLLLKNDGKGTFSDVTASQMPPGILMTSSMALGDVDRDGDLDLIIGNNAQRSCLYLNNGFGTFVDATTTHMPATSLLTTSMALGDVDSDGDLDLILGNRPQSTLLLNNGTGTFLDATVSRMPVGYYLTMAVALGDLDGDGDLDLVLGNSQQQGRCYLNDGTGTFQDATASRMPVGSPDTRSLALGDVDNDGDLDLIVGNRLQQCRLYHNFGTLGFFDATSTHMPSTALDALALALGDVDQDGDLDLLTGTSGQNGLFLNNGMGLFTDATGTRMHQRSEDTRSLVLGDVDGDADLDLVVGNVGQNRLNSNLLRQLVAPLVLRVGHTYRLAVHSRYGPTSQLDIAWPYVSTATAAIPLPPLGTIGIDLARSFAVQPIVVLRPEGTGSLAVPIPLQPTLVGLQMHIQVLLQQHPVQFRFSNVVSDLVLR